MREIDPPTGLRTCRRVPPQAFVVCDDSGNRSGFAGEVGRHILGDRDRRVDKDRVRAIGRQRCVICIAHPSVTERPVGERNEAVRDHVVRRNQPKRREALRRDQHARKRSGALHVPIATLCAAGQIVGERVSLGHTARSGSKRMPRKKVLAIHSGCFVQHDELHRAVRIRIDLVDLIGVERGTSERRDQTKPERQCAEEPAQPMVHGIPR